MFPLIFEKITDFQVRIKTKRVRVPLFFLQHSDVDGYGAFTCEITKKNLRKWIFPIIFIGTVGNALNSPGARIGNFLHKSRTEK